jgi:hypothetical protein
VGREQSRLNSPVDVGQETEERNRQLEAAILSQAEQGPVMVRKQQSLGLPRPPSCVDPRLHLLGVNCDQEEPVELGHDRGISMR